ncbi:MAG TPA: ferritin-like domain-containing protein [Candidatus Dormibacteraeota bacterium]|nr:ferritin-like domain-containing protein [Candidatus Dormibacteraeota bacterium]
MKGDFVMRIETIRKQAREHIDEGPITPSYGADKERVIKVLNEVLATELVCVLRYLRHYYMAEGIDGDSVKATFLEYSNEERNHADQAATRIVQLGGEPDFNPEVLGKRAHTQYKQGASLVDMIKEDLVAERIAISSYQEIVRWLGEGDPTTRRVIEGLLADEEEHADDLRSLLAKMPSK